MVASLCALAGLRVFLFSAAFPIFNHVDEMGHYDLVRKFSRGHWPSRPSETLDEPTARLVVMYGTYEYLQDPANVRPPRNEPLWKQSPETIRREVARYTWVNFEAQSPPVYYFVAGLWHRLGESLGFGEAGLVYWVRFLNAFSYAGLVGLAYAYCRMGCGPRPEIRLGVPLLVAFFPQDVFFGINNDVLSPLLFTATLIGLLGWWRADRPSVGLGAVVGLGAGLTVLVKLTNMGLLAILAAVLAARIWGPLRRGASRVPAASAITAVLAAALPLGLWMARNHSLYGDLTGTSPTLAHLGWTPKPLGSIFEHPIFTPGPAWRYVRHVMSVYWGGEYVWHGKPLVTRAYDLFYAYSSPLLLLAAAIGCFRARRSASVFTFLNWTVVLLGFGCLAAVSVRFDFGRSNVPTPDYPFLATGRLIIGTLVPFAVLYIEGISWVLRPLKRAAAPLVAVAALVVAVAVDEVLLTLPVFKSLFNWFHLP